MTVGLGRGVIPEQIIAVVFFAVDCSRRDQKLRQRHNCEKPKSGASPSRSSHGGADGSSVTRESEQGHSLVLAMAGDVHDRVAIV